MLHSSHMIRQQSFRSFENVVFFFMLHTCVSSCNVKGSLNIECAVRSPCHKVATIPEDATANAILPSNLTFGNIKFVRNVLPVPNNEIISKY